MPVSRSRRLCLALLEETGGEVLRWTALAAREERTPTGSKFDTITDFTHGSDKIDLSAIAGLNSNTQAVSFNSLTSAPASVAAHTIDVVTSGGNTTIYANATAGSETSSKADMEIMLTGVSSMSSTDFVLHH